jgi:hypothetical protein
MRELYELMHRFGFMDELSSVTAQPRRFSLENAAQTLGAFFENVEVHRREDSLQVTEVPPLRNYILSMIPLSLIDDKVSIEELDEQLSNELQAQGGSLSIAKEAGIAIAS